MRREWEGPPGHRQDGKAWEEREKEEELVEWKASWEVRLSA